VIFEATQNDPSLWRYAKGHARIVVNRIIRCTNHELGYVLRECASCGYQESLAPCCCGDRNCPNCGAQKREEWARSVGERFLPSRAFHVVFTIPHQFNAIFKANKYILYNLLMQTATNVLLQFAKNPKHLGGGTPFLMAVLHTWTQTLQYHPHVHALISAGVLRESGEWVENKRDFLFSIKALSRCFIAEFLSKFNAMFRSNELRMPDPCYQGEKGLTDFLNDLPKKWVVFIKKPYKSVDVAIRYFARYANRTAISDKRLISYNDNRVQIAVRRDSCEPEANGDRTDTPSITLSEEDFFRRYCDHIVPRGFHRIRYYGLMSMRISNEKRQMLARVFKKRPEKKEKVQDEPTPYNCPRCQGTHATISLHRQERTQQRRSDTS